ncbi:MAG: rhodanese-like domain-containing protein [Pseudomonadota bacterium]
MIRRKRFVVAGAALLVVACALAWLGSGGWFAEPIPTLSAAEISEAQASGSKTRGDKPLLLVDVRSEREIAVSMIPGAISKAQYERAPERYADYRIVPYCTLGYRSGRYTRRLLDAGRDAVNFEGSIMAWVDAGFPLETPSGEPTRRVHTWSRVFSVPDAYVQVVN